MIVRQAGLTSIAAGASVAAGLLLDLCIAAKFGAGHASDAFFVAVRIPLALGVVAMIVANQAMLPTFARALDQRGELETRRLVSQVLTVVTIGGALLVAVVAVAAGPLVRLTAPGLDGPGVELASSMLAVTFATVPLVGIAEVMRALLNAKRTFVAPAAMSVVMNGLAALVVLASAGDIRRVAVAFVAGAAAQAVFMLVIAWWHGFRYQPSLRLNEAPLIALGRLSIRPSVGAGLNPVARIGEQLMLSFLPVGSISLQTYGYRLISAIGGTVFFRSVVVTVVPRLTTATARGDDDAVRRLAGLAVRLMLAISVPLTVFLAILGRPATLITFQRGNLTRDSAVLLGVVLAVYSASLIGSAVQRALLAPFFARLDTRTPLRNTVYGVLANLVLLPVLVLPFGVRNVSAVVGVAIAYSLAQYVNVAHAWYRLRREIGTPRTGPRRWLLSVVGMSLVSSAVMVVAYGLLRLDQPWHRGELILRTGLVGVGGLAALVVAAHFLRVAAPHASWRRMLPTQAQGRA